MPLPDGVQKYNRRSRAFAKLTRQSSLSTAGATQDDDSCHEYWLPHDLRYVKRTNVQTAH